MSGSPTPKHFADAAAELGLPHPGLVEKDFHVVRTLTALRTIAQEGGHLVFGGGTSLCRAHRLIERMSEDIDLRVAPPGLGEGARKRFRNEVTRVLQSCGFDFNPETDLKSADGYRYSRYKLRYNRSCDLVGSLRPEIKVEISSRPLIQQSQSCLISSFWAEAAGEEPELIDMPCVTAAETCADKFVALTRRIGEELRQGLQQDATLLRHAYDLACVHPTVSMEEVVPMIRQIMESDRTTRARNFPDYFEDPVEVSKATVHVLGSDLAYSAAFDAFVRDMVYGAKLTLHDCMGVLEDIAGRL